MIVLSFVAVGKPGDPGPRVSFPHFVERERHGI